MGGREGVVGFDGRKRATGPGRDLMLRLELRCGLMVCGPVFREKGRGIVIWWVVRPGDHPYRRRSLGDGLANGLGDLVL